MNQFSDLTKFYLMSHPCISSSSSSFWTTYQQTLIKVKYYFHTVKGDFNGYVFPSQDSDASRHVWKSAKWLNFSRGRKSLSGTPSSYLYVAKGGARWDTKGPYLIWRDIFNFYSFIPSCFHEISNKVSCYNWYLVKMQKVIHKFIKISYITKKIN